MTKSWAALLAQQLVLAEDLRNETFGGKSHGPIWRHNYYQLSVAFISFIR